MHRRPLITYLTRLNGQQHRLLLEAAFALCCAALLLRLVHFERLARWLRLQRYETPQTESHAEERLAARIGWAVRAISDRLPWEVKCLIRAFAASLVARWHGLHATIYLGVSRGPGDQLAAHAWSRCGACVITGGAEQPRFAAVAYFAYRTSAAAGNCPSR